MSPITLVKIHPAIGIARLGNSPTDFFIGPEIPLDHTPPPGGYKDASCRVKRQAARFRLFGYDSGGNLVQELTSADAEISWTVHLCNKKASTPARNSGVTGADRAGLVIDPGARTLNGPSQSAQFDNGTFKIPSQPALTVPLGEARTDVDGRLLVLGGFGTSKSSPNGPLNGDFLNNDNWCDDVSDGPVSATVTLKSDGSTPAVLGAWVICPPPKFAPPLDSVITLYDRLFDLFVSQGSLDAPATPSYTNDIYPILNRATQAAFVNQGAAGHHGFTHPVISASARNMIFNKLKGSGGDMPDLNQAQLTATQKLLMEAWNANNFTNDWAGVPSPGNTVTPPGMDRAALEACVGMAFFPGIEAGGIAAAPIVDPTLYLAPFRLDPTRVSAGDITANMACPWQADFSACGSNWWPVPRPNQAIQQGSGAYQEWWTGNGDSMVTDWSTLGFVVQQGNSYVEVERCGTPSITLLTPSLNFQDVPQGPSGMSRKQALAVVFEVSSTSAPITLQFQSGPLFVRLVRFTTGALSIGPTVGNALAVARLWITYETGPVGESVADTVTIVHVESGKTWTVPITANTVPRKTAAAALVLDHSGSMSDDSGDGVTKIQSLREAASIFVDVMLEGDAATVVRFNQTADLLAGVTTLGSASDPFDTGRSAIKNLLNSSQLDPSGSTSIGAGIQTGRQALNAAPGFDVDSLVVLTDGMENTAPFIADVAADINANTYSVGFGTPENISVAALQTISGNHGGYLLMTGTISGDNRFLLQKYFLQILAGISNAEIVLDPQGYLNPGAGQVIPFPLTDADAGVDVILLTPYPEYVNFRLRAPTSSMIIDSSSPAAHPYIQFVRSRGVSYYRISLPTELSPRRLDQGGVWQVLLDIGKPIYAGRGLSTRLSRDVVFIQDQRETSLGGHQGGLPYSLVIHTYSNLSFRASAAQSGYEPGATVQLTATLAESGVPMDAAASVWAEVTTPSKAVMRVQLLQQDDCAYLGKFVSAEIGIYFARVRAAGKTLRGFPFLREQTISVAVWIGGNNQVGNSLGSALCHLLNCLFAEKGLISKQAEEILSRLGFNIAVLRHCLAECAQSRISINERSASAPPSTVATSSLSPAMLSALEQFVKPGQTGKQ